VKRFGIFAALGHLALVLAAMAVVALSRRSVLGAVLVYSPRVLLALPSLFIVPALALRGPRRWLWAQVLTLALVAGPFMGLHLSWPRPGPRTVRLLTWNVWFGEGDAAAVEATVREVGADIYLFQAAASEPDAALHRLEGFHYLHEDQFVLASRWPARVNGMGPLARLHRSWVRFAVDAPFGRLEVISVHPHSPRELLEPRHGGWSRLLHDPEVEALVFLELQLQQIDAEARGAGPLLVVAGDFNVPEGGALLRRLFPGTEDSFAAAGNGYGYTFPVHGRWLPWMRLDRILTGPRLTAVRAEVTGRRGSDHAALLVDLALR
jgi:endonuclease/exonuclease/phosphatase (EEP) superfamily protein YafD